MSLVATRTASVTRLDLGGRWSRLLDGTQIDYVTVPGSYAPVGSCTLERVFDCGWSAGQRVRLVLEGVLASATITLNGQLLGRAGAWAIYDFPARPAAGAGQPPADRGHRPARGLRAGARTALGWRVDPSRLPRVAA